MTLEGLVALNHASKTATVTLLDSSKAFWKEQPERVTLSILLQFLVSKQGYSVHLITNDAFAKKQKSPLDAFLLPVKEGIHTLCVSEASEKASWDVDLWVERTQGWRNLKEIQLKQCQVSDRDLQKLVKACPAATYRLENASKITYVGIAQTQHSSTPPNIHYDRVATMGNVKELDSPQKVVFLINALQRDQKQKDIGTVLRDVNPTLRATVSEMIADQTSASPQRNIDTINSTYSSLMMIASNLSSITLFPPISFATIAPTLKTDVDAVLPLLKS